MGKPRIDHCLWAFAGLDTSFLPNFFVVFEMLNSGVNGVLDSTASVGNGGWSGRNRVVPGLVEEQELNFFLECERLVQYPVEIPTPVLSPKKDPEAYVLLIASLGFLRNWELLDWNCVQHVFSLIPYCIYSLLLTSYNWEHTSRLLALLTTFFCN